MKIAARIVDSRGLIAVDELAADAGMEQSSIGAAFFARGWCWTSCSGGIIRFQQVFRAVEQSNSAWAEIAIECGYYDQAHLIRDFNQFAQQTPAVLFSSQSALTESFTRKSRKSDFYNTFG